MAVLYQEDDGRLVKCPHCSYDLDWINVLREGYQLGHRCPWAVEIKEGHFAPCVLPIHHEQSCIGEVVRPKYTRKYGHVRIYTDGGCRAGVGGWGWYKPTTQASDKGGAFNTTNQRMELTAVIEAVDSYLEAKELTIVSDSAYVVNAMQNRWYEKWIADGWVGSKGQPIANRDLWEKLLGLLKENPNVRLEKVKGHSGDPGNDEADRLATAGRKKQEAEYLRIAKRVNDLRELLHVHSLLYLYYDGCGADDDTWNGWSKELTELHKKHPELCEQGYLPEYFRAWRASLWTHLPRGGMAEEQAKRIASQKKQVM